MTFRADDHWLEAQKGAGGSTNWHPHWLYSRASTTVFICFSGNFFTQRLSFSMLGITNCTTWSATIGVINCITRNNNDKHNPEKLLLKQGNSVFYIVKRIRKR